MPYRNLELFAAKSYSKNLLVTFQNISTIN